MQITAAKTQQQLVKLRDTSSSKKVNKTATGITAITGTQVKNARKAKGWSQGQFAGFLGVSQNLVSLIERDKRSTNKKLRNKIGKLLEI